MEANQFLEDIRPGNIFAGEPPLPGFLRRPRPVAEPVPPSRPGCDLADNVGLAYYYVESLAKGKQGFGVLRQGTEHLKTAARLAAGPLASPGLAADLEQLAQQLADVKDQDSALSVLPDIEQLASTTWELGRACKGVTMDDVQRAVELGRQTARGDKTFEQAREEFRNGA